MANDARLTDSRAESLATVLPTRPERCVKNQLIAVHSVWPFILLLGGGGFMLTGWLPPPSPSLAADRLATMLSMANYPLRIGVSLMATGAPLFVLFVAAVSHQIRRSEGARYVYANTILACSTIAAAMVILPAYLWLAVSYRPELPKEVVQFGSDLAFFLLIAAFQPVVLLLFLVAIAILLGAEERRIYPRWLGYVSVFVAFTQILGLIIPFVKTGPFAFNGLFGFWVILVDFGGWVMIMWWQTLKAIRAEAGNPYA